MSEYILIVDDDLNTRQLMERLAVMLEVPSRSAETGETALELIQAEPPALIMLDHMMPGMSGGDLMKILLDDPATSQIPVVFFTSTPYLVADYVDLPQVEIIQKGSYRIRELMALIEKLMK